MQIAKELNYSYGYIPGPAFGGNCTVNDYTKQSALDAMGPVLPVTWVCRPLPQPYQPRLKLCCKVSFSTPGRSDELKKREWHGCGFQCPLLALWQLTHSSVPSLACSVMWHQITTSDNPTRAYLLKTEEETESQRDRSRVTCPRAAASEHGSYVTLNPCNPTLLLGGTFSFVK